MSGYGIKASKTGYSVHQVPNTLGDISIVPVEKTTFSSGWFAFKITASGSGFTTIPSTTVTANYTTVTIAHGLGYVPFAMAYFSFDSGASWHPSNAETESATVATPLRVFFCQSDETNIYLSTYTNGLAAYSLRIRYFVFADVGS